MIVRAGRTAAVRAGQSLPHLPAAAPIRQGLPAFRAPSVGERVLPRVVGGSPRGLWAGLLTRPHCGSKVSKRQGRRPAVDSVGGSGDPPTTDAVGSVGGSGDPPTTDVVAGDDGEAVAV